MRAAHDEGGDAAPAVANSIRLGENEPRRFLPAHPLARRYEALLRVFNDPAPFAARLAKRLYKSPQRVHELLHWARPKKPRDSGDTPDLPDLIGREVFDQLGDLCAAALPALNSS